MTISHDRDERFGAYAEAQFRFDHPTLGEVCVEPDSSGRTTGAFPLGPGVTVHVVTAHNPGRELTRHENDERHERLTAWVSGRTDLTTWPATGGNADWSHTETSFAIVGLSDAEAAALGREFGQEAVFAWRASEFVVLSCSGDDVIAVGWRIGG